MVFNLRTLRTYATLLLAAAVITACSEDDGDDDGNGNGPPPGPSIATLEGDISASRTLSSDSTYVLRGFVRVTSGATLTIEPGIYIPDWGGVRIEDVVLIEAEGARNLTGAPKRSA